MLHLCLRLKFFQIQLFQKHLLEGGRLERGGVGALLQTGVAKISAHVNGGTCKQIVHVQPQGARIPSSLSGNGQSSDQYYSSSDTIPDQRSKKFENIKNKQATCYQVLLVLDMTVISNRRTSFHNNEVSERIGTSHQDTEMSSISVISTKWTSHQGKEVTCM